ARSHADPRLASIAIPPRPSGPRARRLRTKSFDRLKGTPTGYNATIDAGRLSVHLSWKIRPNSYFDSIDLMRVAEQARRLAGVTEVAVVMGTPTGRAMLAEATMWPAEAPAGTPSDLLMAVRASGEVVARHALA